MEFSEFVGHESAKLGLILNAIEPRCGGILFIGEKGSGKTTLIRLFKRLIPNGMPFVKLPLNVTEDALLGGIDIEKTLKAGQRVFQPGILSRANGGVIWIDDINLLSQDIVSLILEVQSRKEVIIEREGVAVREPADFIIVATMTLEEGSISYHLLDRFGMCVLWGKMADKARRREIIKLSLKDNEKENGSDAKLVEKIEKAKALISKMIVPDQVLDYIVELCSKNFVPGHRGDIYLTYASKAYSAYEGREVVTKEDVDAVAELVLAHRKRFFEPPEENHNQPQPEDPPKEQSDNSNPSAQELPPQEQESKELEKDGNNQGNQPKETPLEEKIFGIGNVFKVRRFLLRKDRLIRSASGRRTKSKTRDRSGRYVKSIMKENGDIAIDATLRASAPYQMLRDRKDVLVIHEEDLRYKQRERRIGHLVIFVVDGSGSMGVQRRMIETKGAIQSLLMDCYQKRDRVSMILFRRDSAEVILPPTSSHEMASRLLAEIPVGGRTPLSAGLLATYKLIKNVSLRNPLTRFLVVLITDGRANQSISEKPVIEEIRELSSLLGKMSNTDFVVVDTEDKSKFIRTDLAYEIALMLGGDYYTLNELKAEYLTKIVSAKKM